MDSSDRGLNGVWAESVRGECLLDQAQAFGDLSAIPQRTILLIEQNQLSRR